MKNKILEKIKGGLIVSCQALPHEPLHSSYIMSRMAVAAEEGGAIGIRANTKEDIIEIKSLVDLPVIGIVKRDYGDCPVFITPTKVEVDELLESKCEIIALDATERERPNGETLEGLVTYIREKNSNVLIMADCATLKEAVEADKLGFDFIGTTLVGYTNESRGDKIAELDFKILRDIISSVKAPVIAEGNVDSPSKAKRVLELGSFTVVVGSIITRPQYITKQFVDNM